MEFAEALELYRVGGIIRGEVDGDIYFLFKQTIQDFKYTIHFKIDSSDIGSEEPTFENLCITQDRVICIGVLLKGGFSSVTADEALAELKEIWKRENRE